MTSTMDTLGDVLMKLAAHPEALQQFLESLPPDDLALAEDVLGERFAVGWRSNPVAMGHHLAPHEIELYPYSLLLGPPGLPAGFPVPMPYPRPHP